MRTASSTVTSHDKEDPANKRTTVHNAHSTLFDQPIKRNIISLHHGIDDRSRKKSRSTMEGHKGQNSPQPKRHRHRHRSSPSLSPVIQRHQTSSYQSPNRSDIVKDDSITTERKDDELYDPYFDELLGSLRKVFPETEATKSTEPVSIINIKSMIPTFSTKEEKPDCRLPLTQFQSNLDEALTSLAKGRRKGRSDRHLAKGVLLKAPKFPSLYLLSSEKTLTEPQKPPVDWFTLTGNLETSAKYNYSVPSKDFDELEILNRRALAVLSHQEWFTAYLDLFSDRIN